MDRRMKKAVDALSNVYAKFFIEDFTNAVIDNLDNNVSLESFVKDDFIAKLTQEKLGAFEMNMEQTNSAALFIQECAAYAIQNEFKNPESRDTFDQIKDLPSIYHDDINQFAHNASTLYLETVDKTLLGVVAKDASIAAQSISNSAQKRIDSVETGGRVKLFNWGVLADGLWLNSALVTGYEKASVFRPGTEVSDSFIQTSFGAARNYVGSPIKSDTNEAFGMLMSQTPSDVVAKLDGAGANRWDIKSLLFNPGSMTLAIDFWETSVNRPSLLIESVEHLSQLAEVLPVFIQVAKKLNQEGLVGDDIVSRVEHVNMSVTLCLVGYEAARETIYSNSLVLNVEGQGNDPMVDVFVNSDTLSDYKNAGGDEQDLISFGTYLDPRKGIITAKGGWSVDWATTRRDNVLTEVAMKEQERLEQKRANDKHVIQAVTKDTLTDVIKSYATAVNLEYLPNRFNNHVGEIARKISSPVALETFSLEGEIVSLLSNVIGDKFVKDVSTRFVNLVTSENEVYQKNARELTIVSTAFDEVLDILANAA